MRTPDARRCFVVSPGCNLWTGREADRETAICDFCDTDFVGVGPDGGKFATAAELASAVASRWPLESRDRRFVVCTGGEPLLQLDAEAVEALHDEGFEVAIETNGTQDAPPGIDWICVSPKAGAPLVLRHGSELKLVFPQPDFEPERFESLDFEHFFLAAHGRAARGREHEVSNRILLDASPLETESSDAQAVGDSLVDASEDPPLAVARIRMTISRL